MMADNSAPRNDPSGIDDTAWYTGQPNLLKGFFEEIGFENFEANEDYRKRTSFDTIGLAAASRNIDDFTVIAVTVRSGGYYLEWANNVWLGDGTKSDYMHEGFYNAANRLVTFLDGYASSKNITGKVKVWIGGFSRGGAVSNVAAGLIDNIIDQNRNVFSNGAALAHDDMFAYTFEAPQGANNFSQTVKKPGDPIYNNIWNVVNPNDLVPKVAMSDRFAFTRFGTDKYVTTKFYDTEWFEDNRDSFKYCLEKLGHSYADFKGDKFTMYGIPFVQMVNVLRDPSGLHFEGNREDLPQKDENKVNYDANIVCDIILEELVDYIGTRENYCKNFQDKMKGLMLNLMDDLNPNKKATAGMLLNSAFASAFLIGLGRTDEALEVLEESLPEENAQNAAKSLYSLAGAVAYIYLERPNELLSLALQYSNIHENHQTYASIAHMQAQDSYFMDGSYYNVVPLRDCADYGRMSFINFNDLSLYVLQGGGTRRVVKLSGYVGLDSDIDQCDDGYALGYYVYMTEERAEIFMPVEQDYVINFKNFSMKTGYKTVFGARYICVGSNEMHLERFTREGCWNNSENFNSELMQRTVNYHFWI